MLTYLQQLDASLLVAINGWHCPFADQLMWLISGKFSSALILITLLALSLRKGNWKNALFLLIAIAIVVLIALSAFFSASEMSFSSANRIRLENMAEDGVRGAKTALHIVEKFDDALSAILIGNNLVNIGMSSLGSVVAILIAGNEDWTWVSTVILTVLVIIFGETMPKIVAKKNANRLVLIFCYPIRLLTIVLKPVIWG